MPRKRKPGRPKGAKNKQSVLEQAGIIETPKKRGRPAGIKAKRRGRPAGISSKSGRKQGRTITRNSFVGGPHTAVNGIHFIGKTLIIDTNEMNVDEVIFLGEGKSPKVR